MLVTKPLHEELRNAISSIVIVVSALGENAHKMLIAGHICSPAHLISEVPSTPKATNSGWMVNSHIDLKTQNTLYYVMEEEFNKVLASRGKRLGQHK
jgi:hypothetical protein